MVVMLLVSRSELVEEATVKSGIFKLFALPTSYPY